MKSKRQFIMKNLILTIAAVFTITFAFAQEEKKEEVKKKVKDKTEKRVDQKIDKTIDDGLDAVENLFKFGKKKKKKKDKEKKKETSNSNTSDQDSQNAMNMLSGMLGGGNVEVEKEYAFQSDMVVEVKNSQKNSKNSESFTVRYFIPEAKNYFGYEILNMEGQDQKFKVVMDWEKSSMLTFMEEQKQIMAMELNTEQIEENINEQVEKTEEGEFDYQNFKKTGNTKEILGYTCEEYSYEDKNTSGSMWVTEEVDANLAKIMGGMSSTSKSQFKGTLPSNYPTGTLMEGTWTDTKSGDVTVWTTKELNIDSKATISTEGYQVMSLGNMFNQGQKE